MKQVVKTQVVNKNAYTPNSFNRVVTIEIKVMLDAVPGAWHKPEDIMEWMCEHSYVQNATLKD